MGPGTQQTTEIWAQLLLCKPDCQRLREFFTTQLRINRRFVYREFHLTVYHGRRPMWGVIPRSETVRLVVPASAMRFMVLAPGGENPRPELDPAEHMIGVRIQRAAPAFPAILSYRDKLRAYESAQVLGRRAPSNDRRNAFGARHFQPHIALLRPGSGVERDLRLIGEPFRKQIAELVFDRFEVKVAMWQRRRGANYEQQAR